MSADGRCGTRNDREPRYSAAIAADRAVNANPR